MTHSTQDLLSLVPDLLAEGLRVENDERDAERAERYGTTRQLFPFFSDVGRCERAIFKSMVGEEVTDPYDTQTLMHFKAGIAYQEAIGQTLARAIGGELLTALKEEESIRLEVDGVTISGRADYLTFIDVEGMDVVIEVKATNSRAIGAFKKKGDWPRDNDKRQLRQYLSAFGRPHGVLYYCERDRTTGRVFGHPFIVEADATLADADFAWLARQKKQADAGSDPGRPPGMVKHKYPCMSCKFRTGCWE